MMPDVTARGRCQMSHHPTSPHPLFHHHVMDFKKIHKQNRVHTKNFRAGQFRFFLISMCQKIKQLLSLPWHLGIGISISRQNQRLNINFYFVLFLNNIFSVVEAVFVCLISTFRSMEAFLEVQTSSVWYSTHSFQTLEAHNSNLSK